MVSAAARAARFLAGRSTTGYAARLAFAGPNGAYSNDLIDFSAREGI